MYSEVGTVGHATEGCAGCSASLVSTRDVRTNLEAEYSFGEPESSCSVDLDVLESAGSWCCDISLIVVKQGNHANAFFCTSTDTPTR